MTLHEELKQLLKKDKRLVSEDKLLKNIIVELALKLDKGLIKLLLNDKKMKEHFFEEIDKILIFDKEKFMKFVDNKEFLPDSYTSFKNKIGLTSDRKYLAKNNEVVLSWPYKDCILEGGQEKEDEKRKEIFHNEILAPDEIDRLLEPKVFTNFKRIDANGEHKVSEINSKDNLIIKGNNLLVLHSLIKRFEQQVKLIYIDPPYNTGSDSFGYNDNFNHSTWLTFMKNRLEIANKLLKEEGVIFVQIDNIEQAYLKVLLDEIFGRENFVSSISWQRAPEGRTVLGQSATFLINSKEEILVYAKDSNKLTKGSNTKKRVDATEKILNQYNLFFENEGSRKLVKELKDKSGDTIKIFEHSGWDVKRIPSLKTDKERISQFEKLSRIAAQQEESSLQQKILKELDNDKLFSVEYIPQSGKHKGFVKKSFYLNGGIILFLKNYAEVQGERIFRLADMNDFWSNDEIQVTGISEEGNVTLRRGKKPEKLIQRIIDLSTNKGDIVLDFNLGSGTTCAVAHKMGRQYIGVEQLNYEENDSVVRLKNVIGESDSKGKLKETIEDFDTSGISKAVNWKGGGDFVYCELKELNEDFVQRIKKAKDSKEILKVWAEMKEHAFLSYRVDEKLFDENIEDFKSLSSDDQKKLLVKCLDANNLYVNYSEIDDEQYKISKDDKEINKKIYGAL